MQRFCPKVFRCRKHVCFWRPDTHGSQPCRRILILFAANKTLGHTWTLGMVEYFPWSSRPNSGQALMNSFVFSFPKEENITHGSCKNHQLAQQDI